MGVEPTNRRRELLWMGVKHCAEQGYPQKEIARKFGISVRTVRNYLRMPDRPRETHRHSCVVAFAPELESMLEACPHASCTSYYYRRLKVAGYQGSLSTVKRWVCRLAANLMSQKRQNS